MSEFQHYPKAMHGPDGAEATVNNADEETALGEGWIDGHEHWAAKAAETEDGEEVKATKQRGRPKKVAE